MNNRCLIMALAGLMLLACPDARADEDESAVELDPVVVVASRTPRPLSAVAAQVTVLDAATLRAHLAEDLDDALRYEPGLEMETAGTRFGGTGISIRGIGGNRVEIEQDGVPVRDRFVVGAFSDGGRNLVEIDRVKRIEVLHGPASVLYGSNALGGVVAITTWDPDDVLASGDGRPDGSVRAGYRGADRSRVGSGIAAAAWGPHAMMAALTLRDGHERDNRAAGVPDDPQAWDSRDGMARYTFDTPGGNRLRVTAAAQDRDVTTEVRSQLGYGRRFRTTTALRGIDHDESGRLALEYQFATAGAGQNTVRGTMRAYRTDFETDQRTLERREAAAPPVAIERRFLYEQQHTGLDFNLFRTAWTGGLRHRLGAGMEWLQTESSELRDGTQTNLLSGATTSVILGESMPVRDFPDSRSRELGLFVQDEIASGSGRWELIPALRWDRYELDPRPDLLWLEDYPDFDVVPVEESELTPRLGCCCIRPRAGRCTASMAAASAPRRSRTPTSACTFRCSVTGPFPTRTSLRRLPTASSSACAG